MMARTSKSARLYDQIRRALEAGYHAPGERIDPNALADEYATSPTPVLYALHRLVGEGMIADHPHEGGFHVPLMTEHVLRDYYDWMRHLLLTACDIGFAPAEKIPDVPIAKHDDIVLQTRALFDTMAFATGRHCIFHAVRRANDHLAPYRRAKQVLLPNGTTELAHLHQLWTKRNIVHLKPALAAYHERRIQLVPSIVALANSAMPLIPERDAAAKKFRKNYS